MPPERLITRNNIHGHIHWQRGYQNNKKLSSCNS